MLDVIVCANFGVEKLRGLGNTRGQILEFPIEMAGRLYNRAGATRSLWYYNEKDVIPIARLKSNTLSKTYNNK